MSFARPDEMASDSRIQASHERDGMYKSGAKTLANAGLAVAGVGVAAKIAPFLSGVIPTDLALKGISKIAPRVGDFLQKGMAQGLTIQSGLDFLKENLGEKKEASPEEPKEKAKDNRNIIEQYSPSIFLYLKDLIGKGSTPIEAATKAKKFLPQKDKDIIKNIEKDHKTDFNSIVESILGGAQQSQAPQQGQQMQNQQMQQQAGQQAQQNQGIDPQLASIMGDVRKLMQNAMNK